MVLVVVPPPVTVRVPAKVNLHLAVGDARPDGYHDLVTVYQALSLCDEVTVAVSDNPGVETHGEGAGGVAGGSADAAAALLGLASLWKLELSRDELTELAATLGSDVPFALHGGT